MSFTAKIPKTVVFALSIPENDEVYVTNTDWYDLPEDHPAQKDVQRFQKETVYSEPFLVSTKKELDKYKNDKSYFVYDNKPTDAYLSGYLDVGTKNYSRFEPQVSLPTGHTITISHDILVNALLKGGIEKDGKLPGKFFFASINRKLKLVQENSGIHKAINTHLKKRSRRSLGLKEMDVGKVYRTAAGNTGLFLGFITTETMVVDTSPDIKGWNKYQVDRSKLPPIDFGVRFLPQELASLWFKVPIDKWRGGRLTQQELFDRFMATLSGHLFYSISANKSHSFIEEVEGYHIDFPFDVVTHVRAKANERAGQSLMKNRLVRTNPNISWREIDINDPKLNAPDIIRHEDAVMIENYAGLANMSLFGSGIIRSDVFKQFDPWETKTNKFKGKK